jgi:hypothetical protein
MQFYILYILYGLTLTFTVIDNLDKYTNSILLTVLP